MIRDEEGTSYVGLGTGNGAAAIAGTSGLIFWDTATGTPTMTDLGATVVAMRSDDVTAAAANDTTLELLDLSAAEPEVVAELGSHAPTLSFSPDGNLLAALRGVTITLWDVEDPAAPEQVATKTPGSLVSTLTVLDDGRVVFSASTATLSIWDALGDGSIDTIDSTPPGTSTVSRIDVDDDASRALLDTPSVGAGIQMVDLNTGETIRGFIARDPALQNKAPPITWNAAMNPAGDRVAAFDLGGRGFVLDAQDGSLLAELTGHAAIVIKAAFLANGQLVTTGLDGTVRLWDTEAPERTVAGPLDDALCDVFADRIDQQSWELAMGDAELTSPCD